MARILLPRDRSPAVNKGLIGHWFDRHGRALHDVSNHGLHLTYSGALPEFIPTPFGTGCSTYNSARRTYIPSQARTSTPARSITGWGWLNSIGNSYIALAAYREVNTMTFTPLVKAVGSMAMYIKTVSGTVNYDGTGVAQTLTTGVWYHFAMTYDAVDGLDGYVNAVLDKHVAANGAIDVSYDAEVYLGGAGPDGVMPDRFWTGNVSSMRLYDRKLTAGEVAAIYQSELSRSAGTVAPPTNHAHLGRPPVVRSSLHFSTTAGSASAGASYPNIRRGRRFVHTA